MDFGASWDGGPFGIPYVVVGAGQKKGGANADGDRHVLVVDSSTHRLYELYDANRQADGSWHAGSGAVFDLDAGTTRPAGWTSADVDISGYPPQARVILQAMKTYGLIVADNGSSWFVSWTPDARWDDDQLNTLKNVHGSAFEVVAMGQVTTG